jgi:DNA modification methylase
MHFADGEMAWTNFSWGTMRIFNFPISRGDTKGHKVHPTQKPISVMSWSILQTKIAVGATILDPFFGSGTTGVACVQTGRKCIGVEIEEKYCEIAAKRIDQALMQPALAGLEVA